MEEESGPIVAMVSKEGEEMPLIRPVKTSGNIEAWLNKVQDEMKETLIKKLAIGNKDIVGTTGKAATPRNEWVKEHKGQVVTTIAMIQWCLQTEDTINAMMEDPANLQNWFDTQVKQLEELTILIRGNLTDLQRMVLVALVTQDVHARDITDTLQEQKVCSIYEFTWQQQLRFYYADTEEQGPDANPINVK